MRRRCGIGDNSPYAVRVRKCLALGICVRCRQPKSADRLRYRECTACAEYRVLNRQPAVPGERKQRARTGYEAVLSCKRCGRRFQSTDRRSVRHCETCRKWLELTATTLGIGGEWAV